MKTVVTKRGQTVIPAVFRKKIQGKKRTVLLWIDTGERFLLFCQPYIKENL